MRKSRLARKRAVRRAAVSAGQIVELAAYEALSPPRRGLARRWRAWRRGFLSEAAALYGTEGLDNAAYLTDYERYVRTPLINGDLGVILDNKLAFHLVMERFALAGDIPPCTPRMAGVVVRGRFRPLDSRLHGSGAELIDVLAAERRLVVKPVEGKEGDGVLVLEAVDDRTILANGRKLLLEGLDGELEGRDGDLVVEFIQQAEYSAALYPSTTNTIRALTMLEPETGRAFMPAAVHRIGTIRSEPVDNWTRGGVAAAVDVDTGTLGQGAAFPVGEPVRWFDTHPDSGASITGTEVTGWAAIRAQLLTVAERLPFLPCVGWDVVVTDDGFRLLEGNNRIAARIFQVNRPLLDDDRVRAFLTYHDVLRRRRSP